MDKLSAEHKALIKQTQEKLKNLNLSNPTWAEWADAMSKSQYYAAALMACALLTERDDSKCLVDDNV